MQMRAARVALALFSITAVVGVSGVALAVTGTSQPNLVSATPSTHTPNINNGIVEAITQVDSKIIVGGSFTSVNPPGDTNSAHAVTRNFILAFDQATGVVDTAFVPTLDGTVESLIPGPSAGTVYVGGEFNNVNGAKEKGIALLSTTTGATVSTFHPAAMNGVVYSMVNTNGHLILGGTFTTLAGVTHDGVGSLDSNTGAVQSYISTQLTGHHNYNGSGANGAVGPRALDVSPNGSLLVVIGNFKMADGVVHDQIAEINLGSTSAALNTAWNTQGYTAACANGAFDTYMRDMSFAPDGTYFTVVATGGGTFSNNTDGTRSLCDTTTRWETNGSGSNVQPTWINYSGNDSYLSVVATGTAIYVGGHQRWTNNSAGSDSPAEGAIPRPGLMALDPVNGMPFSWNPGRNPRGSGAWALFASSQGLYMGSDTDKIGAGATFTNRGKIAFFPLAGGEQVSAFTPPALPANIYLAGQLPSGLSTLTKRSFTGTTAGPTSTVDTATVTWSQVRGAFMVGSKLFYGLSDGNLYETTFDGTTLGAPTLVDPYDDPVWDNEDTGSGQTYRGVKASLYGTEMQNVTGMVYSNGKLYYSTAGSTKLHYRYFEADDGAVGSSEFTASGTSNLSSIEGMFLSGSTLYYAATSTGNLHAVAWNNGAPDATTDTTVSGPTIDGNDWRTHGMFGLSGAAIPPPIASFTASCTALNCSFDASASSAPGSTITSYAWNFGDGNTGTGVTTSHTYASSGTDTVSLTVTNAAGNSTTTTQVVSPHTTASPIAFVGSASVNGNKSALSVTVPASVSAGNAMLVFASVANTVPVTAPAGWTLVGQTPSSLTSITTAIFSKVATASDAGSTVTVGFSGTPHETVQLVAYSGTSTGNPVLTAANNSVTGGTSLTSPTVSIGAGGTWVISYYSAKSSVVTAWTVPASQTTRNADNGTGSGRINSVIADSGTDVAAGSGGGITATTDQPVGGADSWTIVLTP